MSGLMRWVTEAQSSQECQRNCIPQQCTKERWEDWNIQPVFCLSLVEYWLWQHKIPSILGPKLGDLASSLGAVGSAESDKQEQRDTCIGGRKLQYSWNMWLQLHSEGAETVLLVHPFYHSNVFMLHWLTLCFGGPNVISIHNL